MSKKKNEITLDESVIDSLFSEMCDSVAESSDNRGDFLKGDEIGKLMIALPVPALSIRYFLQQEGFPLGRFTMIVGKQGSSKSSLMYEIMRWHNLQKGRNVVVDTEFKPAPDLMWSILEYKQKAISYVKCKTIEGWQEALNSWIQQAKEKMDGPNAKTKGFGRIIPFCFGIDSIMACLDSKEYERIEDEGSATKHYATAAFLITDYLKVLTKQADGYPFSFLGINHLKDGQTPTGVYERRIAGGAGLKFHETTEIEMRLKSSMNPTTKSSSLKRHISKTIEAEGVDLEVCMFKNSAGPREFIGVEMLWYIDHENKIKKIVQDPETGEQTEISVAPQRTFFDWHCSTTELILTVLKEKSKRSERLKEILVVEGNEDKRYCSSSTFGISDKISWREMGELIENKIQTDSSFADALYPVLGIQRRFMYKPGVDYLKQIESAKIFGVNH